MSVKSTGNAILRFLRAGVNKGVSTSHTTYGFVISSVVGGLTVREELADGGVSVGRVVKDKDGRIREAVEGPVVVYWPLLSLHSWRYETEVTYHSGETSDITGGLHNLLAGTSILLPPVTDDCD